MDLSLCCDVCVCHSKCWWWWRDSLLHELWRYDFSLYLSLNIVWMRVLLLRDDWTGCRKREARESGNKTLLTIMIEGFIVHLLNTSCVLFSPPTLPSSISAYHSFCSYIIFTRCWCHKRKLSSDDDDDDNGGININKLKRKLETHKNAPPWLDVYMWLSWSLQSFEVLWECKMPHKSTSSISAICVEHFSSILKSAGSTCSSLLHTKSYLLLSAAWGKNTLRSRWKVLFDRRISGRLFLIAVKTSSGKLAKNIFHQTIFSTLKLMYSFNRRSVNVYSVVVDLHKTVLCCTSRESTRIYNSS